MNTTKKYGTGLALSGGGAKAAAHCGALKALEEHGIRPDIIAGTSAGALAAVYYSSGYTPEEIIDMFEGLSFFRDIVSPNVPKGGLFDSKPLLEHIRKNIPYKRLEGLPIPAYIVASDMELGRVKVFSEGELAPIVVASCSIPMLFTPMLIDGHHYLDGGVFMNLPIQPLRDCCEKIIALNLNHINEEEYHSNLIYVAQRSFSMTVISNTMASIPDADLYIDLDTKDANVYDMGKIPELFEKGYESAVRVLAE